METKNGSSQPMNNVPRQSNSRVDGHRRISWHPAFIEALQLELEAYQDALEFYPEYPLTSEPLRIDCVVIKKTKDVDITKNIAVIFRTWNIIEYKAPGDYISVADFYKVYGYACLYASFKNIPITDLTITFIESRYPEKLLEHLKKERGYTVEENGSGIYTISGDILPIQLIDSRFLPEEENLWLKSLRMNLDIAALNKVSAEMYRKGKSARVAAYWDAIVRANAKTIKEAIQMSDASLTIEQVFEDVGWIAKWEARGKAEGEARGRAEGEARGKELGALKIAQNMVALGFPLETIVSATQLEPEKVQELYQYPSN